jgi:hypothetical protein
MADSILATRTLPLPDGLELRAAAVGHLRDLLGPTTVVLHVRELEVD